MKCDRVISTGVLFDVVERQSELLGCAAELDAGATLINRDGVLEAFLGGDYVVWLHASPLGIRCSEFDELYDRTAMQ